MQHHFGDELLAVLGGVPEQGFEFRKLLGRQLFVEITSDQCLKRTVHQDPAFNAAFTEIRQAGETKYAALEEQITTAMQADGLDASGGAFD